MANHDDSTVTRSMSSGMLPLLGHPHPHSHYLRTEIKAEDSSLNYVHDSESSSRNLAASAVVPEDSASQTFSEASSTILVAPPNTPATRSAADAVQEDNQRTELRLAVAQIVLDQHPGAIMPTRPTPSATSEVTSQASIEKGRAHLRGPFRSELDMHKQLFKAPLPKPVRPLKRKKYKTKLIAPPPKTASSSSGSRANGGVSPPNEHVHEFTMWPQYAEEDLERGLKRAQQLAEDTWRNDQSRSITQVYSELVSRMIKKQGIVFDASYLN
jgi:hypothetical protein